MATHQPKIWDITGRTFEFAVRIVELCEYLDATPGVRRRAADQLFRAGTSIGANVEEGQAGQSKPDFISKYNIALKESRETHYWLRLIQRTKLIDPSRLISICTEAEEIKKILGACV